MKLKTGQLVRATSKDENGYWDSRIGTVEQIECEYTGSGYVTTIWIKFEGNDSLFGYHPRFVKELNELEKIKVYHTDAIRLQEIADNNGVDVSDVIEMLLEYSDEMKRDCDWN